MILPLFIIPIAFMGMAIYFQIQTEKAVAKGYHPYLQEKYFWWCIALGLISFTIIIYILCT